MITQTLTGTRDTSITTTAPDKFRNVSLLIIKTNHRCNLSCEYCYENIVPGEDLSIEALLDASKEILAQTMEDRVNFVFHGGEPTLMTLGWYIFVIEGILGLARAYRKQVCFSMQTNLVSISDTQVDFFREYGVKISASIDGPNGSEQQRQLASKARDNFLRLKQQGLNVGLLANVNPTNFHAVPEFILWLRSELGISRFKANLAYPVGAGLNAIPITPDEAFAAQRHFLDHLVDTNGSGLIEDNTAFELLRFFGMMPNGYDNEKWMCMGQHCGAGKSVVSVSPNGSILPCGRFSWDDKKYQLSEVGRVNDQADYIITVNRLHSEAPENWASCAKCEAKQICSFGCQAFIVRSRGKRNIECAPTKMRFSYIQDNETKFYPVAKIILSRLSKNSKNTNAPLKV